MNQRLQQALKHNEELEAKIQDLQKRLSEAEPKDGKAQIQLDESSNRFFEIHPVWAHVSEYLQASDLRNLSFSEKNDMLRKFFKTQLKLRDEKNMGAMEAVLKALRAEMANAMAEREVVRRLFGGSSRK